MSLLLLVVLARVDVDVVVDDDNDDDDDDDDDNNDDNEVTFSKKLGPVVRKLISTIKS